MSEENKAIVSRFWEEAWNRGNLAVIDEVYDPNHILRAQWQNPALGGATETTGQEVARRVIAMWREALPDLHVTLDEQIAEGDKVMTRHTSYGSHTGAPFMGIQPSGKAAAVSGMTINRLAGGKIVETWTNWDALGLLQGFGVIPPAGGPPGGDRPGGSPPGDRPPGGR